MKQLLFILIASISFFCHGQESSFTRYQKSGNSLLWEISGKNLTRPSYLFGTFHLLCKDDIHFSNILEKSLKNSQSLYLEMDLDDPQNTWGALSLMNMKNGQILKDLYTPDEYARLKRFFSDSLELPMTMIEHWKPILITTLLYPKMMACKTIDGIEQELMALAKKEKKEIKGLETMAFQSAVLDQIPYTVQAKELLNTIDSINDYKQKFNEWRSIYISQDLKKIETSFEQEPNFEEDKALMLDNRNENWIKKIENILINENVFIAVGAAHLVGEKGLIALLKAKGYTLKAIKN